MWGARSSAHCSPTAGPPRADPGVPLGLEGPSLKGPGVGVVTAEQAGGGGLSSASASVAARSPGSSGALSGAPVAAAAAAADSPGAGHWPSTRGTRRCRRRRRTRRRCRSMGGVRGGRGKGQACGAEGVDVGALCAGCLRSRSQAYTTESHRRAPCHRAPGAPCGGGRTVELSPSPPWRWSKGLTSVAWGLGPSEGAPVGLGGPAAARPTDGTRGRWPRCGE